MATEKTVKVRAIQVHTAFGEAYLIGDIYDIPAEYADSVVAQGKAERVDATKPDDDDDVKPKTLAPGKAFTHRKPSDKVVTHKK